jgi:hypothetical protein
MFAFFSAFDDVLRVCLDEHNENHSIVNRIPGTDKPRAIANRRNNDNENEQLNASSVTLMH